MIMLATDFDFEKKKISICRSSQHLPPKNINVEQDVYIHICPVCGEKYTNLKLTK